LTAFPSRQKQRFAGRCGLRLLWFALLLVLPAAAPAAAPQEGAKPQDDPAPAQDKNAEIEANRGKVLDPGLEEGSRGIAASELIQAGDMEWLNARLGDRNTPEHAVLAIVEAFKSKRNHSAFKEILLLSRDEERPEIRKRCSSAVRSFLDDKETHTAVMKVLAVLGTSRGETPLLRKAAVWAMGISRDLGAVDTLLALMETEGPEFGAAANLALQTLTLRNFGRDAAAWKTWWAENRGLSRDRIIEEGRLAELEHQVSAIRGNYIALVKTVIDNDLASAFGFLDSDMEEVRRSAACALSAHASDPAVVSRSGEIVARLQKGETDSETLVLLIGIAGRGNDNSADTQQILLIHLHSADPSVVEAAAGSLRTLKGKDPAAVAQAVSSRLAELADRSGKPAAMTSALLDLLRDCGEKGAKADLSLVRKFSAAGQDPAVRKSAIPVLGLTGDAEALGDLSAIIESDPDAGTRFWAAYGLELLGRTGTAENGLKEKSVEALARGLEDSKANVRSGCVRGMGVLGTPEVIAILKQHLLKERDGKICTECIDVFGRFKNPEGLKAIALALAALRGREGLEEVFRLCENAARSALKKICRDRHDLWKMGGDELLRNECFLMAAWCFEEFFEKAKNGNGDDEEIARVKGLHARALFEGGEIERALPLLEELQKNGATEPSERDRLCMLAEGCRRIGRFEESARWYDLYLGVISKAETSVLVETYTGAWEVHFEAKKYKRALELVQWLMEQDPKDNTVLFRFALTQARADLVDGAEKEFDRLLDGRLGPGEHDLEWRVRCELAEILLLKKDSAKAVLVLEPTKDPLPDGLGNGLKKRVTDLRQKAAADKAAADKAAAEKAAAEKAEADKAETDKGGKTPPEKKTDDEGAGDRAEKKEDTPDPGEQNQREEKP